MNCRPRAAGPRVWRSEGLTTARTVLDDHLTRVRRLPRPWRPDLHPVALLPRSSPRHPSSATSAGRAEASGFSGTFGRRTTSCSACPTTPAPRKTCRPRTGAGSAPRVDTCVSRSERPSSSTAASCASCWPAWPSTSRTSPMPPASFDCWPRRRPTRSFRRSSGRPPQPGDTRDRRAGPRGRRWSDRNPAA